MYDMNDVMAALSSDHPNKLFTAYALYWHATERALPFETCVRHVDVIAAKLRNNNPISTDLRDFRQALVEGMKIDAIKALRAATGWGLKDAKDAVESFLGQYQGINLYPKME